MNIQESEAVAVVGAGRSSERSADSQAAPERFVEAAGSTADEARDAGGQVLERAAVEKVLGEAQDELSKRGVALKFKLMEGDNQYQVEVRDKNSDKIIRKLPPDEVVNLSRSLKDLAGALLDKGI